MTERVLVTGAGGFIGGRIAEVLHCAGIPVRAGVRQWSTAARIARFPMDIVQADVCSAESMENAMRDVAMVVHCAYGDARTNRDGAATVLDVALRAGVRRVVHLSTIAVYGRQTGTIDETAPVQRTGSEYGDSKIDAEALCWDYCSRGLPVVVLRPTIVYGPFSKYWTVEFAERMIAGSWLLPRTECEGICNLVYVDDVVGAVVRALRCQDGAGQAFNVNGPEPSVTWNQYFDALNAALDLPPLSPPGAATARAVSASLQPARMAAKYLLRRFPDLIMNVYKRNALARNLMKRAEAVIRRTPTGSEFELYSRKVAYPTEKARAVLGYTPKFDMATGVELSAAWLRHHRYLRPSASTSA